MNEQFPKVEFSRRGSVTASLLASALFTIGGAATDNLQTVEWMEGADTVEQTLEHSVDYSFVIESTAEDDPNVEAPRCQLVEEELIQRSKTPEEPKHIFLPTLMPIPWIRFRGEDDKLEESEIEVTTPEGATPTVDTVPESDEIEQDEPIGDDPNTNEEVETTCPPLKEDTQVDISPPRSNDSDLTSFVAGGGGLGRMRNRHMRQIKRRQNRHRKSLNKRLKKIKIPEEAKLGIRSNYENDLRAIRTTYYDSTKAYSANRRSSSLKMKAVKALGVPLALAGLVYGYKASSFDFETCAVDVDKNSGAFNPGLNWHWDCEFSVPDPKPQIPSGGGSRSSGDNPCEEYPIYYDNNKTYVDVDGNVVETKDGVNKRVSYVNAMSKLARAKNQGASIQAG